jgi:hypothetical protein
MARGDVKLFAEFILKSKAGTGFNLTSDTLKLGIVGNGVTPSVSTTDPRWGVGGTTDFSAQQVATGTAYTGPVTLTSVGYTRSSGVNTITAANITISQDASGFTTGYWGILYNDTVAGKFAIGFVDLGGPVSIVGGALNINWNASGIATETAS